MYGHTGFYPCNNKLWGKYLLKYTQRVIYVWLKGVAILLVFVSNELLTGINEHLTHKYTGPARVIRKLIK